MDEVAGEFDQRAILHEIPETKGRQTALLFSCEFAGSTKAKVRFRDFKAVTCLGQNLETLRGFVRDGITDEDAMSVVGAASDAAAELMQLSESELLGILDHHDGGIGDIHTDLDDTGGEEDLDGAGPEVLHDPFLGVGGQLAVEQSDRMWGEESTHAFVFARHGFDVVVIGFHDAWVNHVGLAAGGDLLGDEFPDARESFCRSDMGLDTAASGGQLRKYADIEIAIEREAESAWDGSGGHHEQVGI